MIFFFPPLWRYFYYYIGSMMCGALPGAVLVILLVRTSGHFILERPEIVLLGKIFYGIYLWHHPILRLLTLMGASELVSFFIGFPLTILMATVSYAYIERHFMRVRLVRPAQALADTPREFHHRADHLGSAPL